MRRSILVSLALVLLLGAAPRPGAADELLRPVRVLGKRTRKIVRHQRYQKTLQGDKLRVFEDYGFTPFRLREDRGVAGVVERWRYPERGLEFVFDAAGRRLERRRVTRGDTSFD